LLLLGLFPVLAATADLTSDLHGELPTDHQATFAVVAGQQWASARQTTPGLTSYVTLLETGYAVHELVFGLLFLIIVAVPLRRGAWWAWWACWCVLIADLGYTLTFGQHDATILGRSLIADVALPVLLLAQLPWLLSGDAERSRLKRGAAPPSLPRGGRSP
jgi:hypothetical protein